MSDQKDWLAFASDADCASWIGEALDPKFGTVSALIPSVFESYVRILHPAESLDGDFVTWRELAEQRKCPLTPTTQWSDLAAEDLDTGLKRGSKMTEPETGSLDPVIFNSVCEVLRRFTLQSVRCLYGLWAGRTEVGSEARIAEPTRSGSTEAARSLADLDGPIFEPWPNKGRQYLLLEGSIVSADTLARFVGRDEAFWMSPNFVWSRERTWFLTTDIDQNSTLLGGSTAMSEAIMASPQIEALPIAPGDRIC